MRFFFGSITAKKAAEVLGSFSHWVCRFLISTKLISLRLKNSTSLRSGLRQFQFLYALIRQALFTKIDTISFEIKPQNHSVNHTFVWVIVLFFHHQNTKS
jgi:hypothetical protein